MKLGLQSAILAEYTFEQVVELCSEIGFECIEAMCWPQSGAQRRYGGVTHLDIASLTQDELLEKLQYAADRKISVSALGYYPNPLSPNITVAHTAVEHIKSLIKTAGETGIGMVTTFIGRDKNKNVEENLALYQRVWSPIVELAEQYGVKIAIENCPMLFTRDEWPGGDNLAASPAVWDEMFRLIDSDYLGLNYDPSHCVALDMDYIKPIYQFRKKMFHIHFKDTRIYRDKLDQFGRQAYPLSYMAPKLPGLGEIDWAAFCSALYDIHFCGNACIEVEDRAFEGSEAEIITGIRLAYATMRRFL